MRSSSPAGTPELQLAAEQPSAGDVQFSSVQSLGRVRLFATP